HAGHLLFGRVIAQLVALGLCQDAKKRWIAVCYPMTKGETADEDRDPSQNGIEEIEGSHRADADEVEQRALHAQVGKRLMQPLEDSICPMLLLCFVRHKGVPVKVG